MMMIDQPLRGKRIAITRPEGQARDLIDHLHALGADAIATPTIAIAPLADFAALDAAIVNIASYDWVIATSANGVEVLFERMAALGVDPTALQGRQIGAIGPATASAFASHGVTPTFVPSAYVAEGILAEIGDVGGQRIFLPRADIAREALAAGLREQGAVVDEIAAYRTIPGAGIAQLAALLRAHELDAITFTSSSTVRYLLDGLERDGISREEARELLQQTAVICIGPITSGTASDEGVHINAVAHEYTSDGVIQALVRHFGV